MTTRTDDRPVRRPRCFRTTIGPRVDLGALRARVGRRRSSARTCNEAQQVVSATLASTDGQMQLGIFAAPRNEEFGTT